jgi:hypothetical membrane protein
MTVQRVLLWCGVGGTASFVVTFLLNDALWPDYDPMHDSVSEAAIGPGGWVQIASFIFSGLLITASSFALSRAVNRRTGRLVRTFGVGLVLAGVFVSDPVPHDHATSHGTAHTIVSIIVFTSLVLACFAAAGWRPDRVWRWYCIATGVAVVALFVGSGGVGIWQRLTIAVGWAWLIVLTVLALRATPDSTRRF